MIDTLVLPGKIVKQVLSHVRQHDHHEACGLISAANGIAAHYYAVDNIAPDPAIRFEMEPGQQIAAMKHMREHGEELFAIVHSHPHSPPIPSATDVQACGYPDAYYIIVSLQSQGAPEIRAYKNTDGEMHPISLREANQG